MVSLSFSLEFTADPGAFLDLAGAHLDAHPVTANVVASVAHRAVREGVGPEPGKPWWFAVLRDRGGALVSVAMRTAPGPHYPAWIDEMPEQAAIGLARELHARGEFLGGANGALPATRVVAEETARLWSKTAVLARDSRLFELGTLLPPTGVPGRLRKVRPDEEEFAHAWHASFHAEAAEQAEGRSIDDGFEVDLGAVRRKIDSGNLWFWEVDGEVVHMTGANPPSFGVARIGPVFTPAQHRGNRYASAAVAAISQLFLDQRARVCLFTDLANPVSNKVYQRIGYRSVVDMANYLIT
jgi:RimJ/RimL family protein N-acetyltransferase